MANERAAMSNAAKLALAWLLVGIPLVWGVIKTIHNALALFQ